MKCFRHRPEDAVGVCKSCQKGICFECAADTPAGLACKSACEQTVIAVDAMVRQTVQAKPMRMTIVLYVFFGVTFGFVGYLVPAVSAMVLPVSGIFLLGAAFLYFNHRRRTAVPRS